MQLLLPTTYHHSRRSSKTRSVRTPAVSRATAVEPLWTKPSLFFYLPCGLFWLTILLTYVTEQVSSLLQASHFVASSCCRSTACHDSRQSGICICG